MFDRVLNRLSMKNIWERLLLLFRFYDFLLEAKSE